MNALEQLRAERRTGIGSSDAAALFNEGYGCWRKLVYQKQGIAPDYEPPDKLVFERGIALEPVVAQRYADITKRSLSTVGVSRHALHDYLLVHADRLVLKSEEHAEVPGVLELKTSGREVFRKLQKGGMQEDHILQVQWALMVTGLTWASYCALWPDGWEMVYFDVEPEKDIIDGLYQRGVETWTMVENGPLPERLEPDDHRCLRCEFRRQCQGNAMLELLGKDAGKPTYDESLGPLVEAYIATQEITKNAEELEEEARNELEQAIGERTRVDTIGGFVTWKPHTQKRVNSDRLRQKYPKVYEDCVKESVVRPLRVYPQK